MEREIRTRWFSEWLRNGRPGMAGGEGEPDPKPDPGEPDPKPDPGVDPGDKPKAFVPPKSQAEFDSWTQERIDRATEKIAKETADRVRQEIQDKAEAEAKKEAGKFDELFQEEQKKNTDLLGEIDELKASIAERDRKEVRNRIARKHNLPENLWDRLVGDDEKALEEDAKALAQVVKVQAPNTEGGSGDRRKGSRPKGGDQPYSFRRDRVVMFPDKVPAKE
jgi:hypothetical protein